MAREKGSTLLEALAQETVTGATAASCARNLKARNGGSDVGYKPFAPEVARGLLAVALPREEEPGVQRSSGALRPPLLAQESDASDCGGTRTGPSPQAQEDPSCLACSTSGVAESQRHLAPNANKGGMAAYPNMPSVPLCDELVCNCQTDEHAPTCSCSRLRRAAWLSDSGKLCSGQSAPTRTPSAETRSRSPDESTSRLSAETLASNPRLWNQSPTEALAPHAGSHVADVAASAGQQQPCLRRAPGAASSASTWRQWRSSSVQVDHVTAEERARRKRERLLEELHRREEEQCTFTPQLLPRRVFCSGGSSCSSSFSPRRSTRHLGLRGSPTCPSQELLRQCHKESASTGTAAPQQRSQSEAPLWRAAREDPKREERGRRERSRGSSSQSVFERLYACGVAAKQQTAGEADFVSTPSPRPPGHGPCRLDSSGRPLIGQLLFNDAMDRQQRQRAMEEEASRVLDAKRRECCQVLARSRRYYWQMLERQIRIAFDLATAGGDHLTCATLEDFLVYFGVVRPARTPAVSSREHSTTEAQRLCAGLWRHLDPAGMGQTDFLTLTVFFHVLMGAVDDEAQCLHNLSRGCGQSPAASTQPSLVAAAQPGQTTGEGTAAFEDGNTSGDLTEASDQPPSGVISEAAAAAAAATAAAAAADPEGRRICELLMRFNPRQLRAEFRQLYLDRMHLWTSTVYQIEEPLHTPFLNAQSRAIADRVVQRQMGHAEAQGSSVHTHAELLQWRHAQAEARKEDLRLQRGLEEAEGCTFRPSITASSRWLPVETHVPSSPSYRRLHADSAVRQLQRQARAAAHEGRRVSTERQLCTFRPDLRQSERSFVRSLDSSTPRPRGFSECTQRLRRASASRAPRLRFFEDRWAATPELCCEALAQGRQAEPAEEEAGDTATGVCRGTRTTDTSGTGHRPAQEQRAGQAVAVSTSSPEKLPPSASSLQRSPGRGGADLLPGAGPGLVDGRSPPKTARKAARSESPLTAGEALPRAPSAALPQGRQGQGRRSVTVAGLEDSLGSSLRSSPSSPAASIPCARGQQTARGKFSVKPRSHAPAAPPPSDSATLHVDVNIAPGAPPERLIILQGESPREAVREFARAHNLAPRLALRLHELLEELVRPAGPPEAGPAASASPRELERKYGFS